MGYRLDNPVRRDRDSIIARGQGFLWEVPCPRNVGGGQTTLTSGTQYYTAVGLIAGETVSGLAVDCVTGGSSLSLVKLGLLASDGTILAQTADVKASFTGTGIISSSFTSAYTPVADVAVYAVIVCTHTGTGPNLTRFQSTYTIQRLGSNMFAAGRRTGLSDISATAPASGDGPDFWFAGV